jgi:hypothetical protein
MGSDGSVAEARYISGTIEAPFRKFAEQSLVGIRPYKFPSPPGREILFGPVPF